MGAVKLQKRYKNHQTGLPYHEGDKMMTEFIFFCELAL